MLPQQRLMLVQTIELIATLEECRRDVADAVHRAAGQIGEGKDAEAVATLRSTRSEAVVAMASLLELHLLAD